MVWQAFMDESKAVEGGYYVIGGCIARAEVWTRFSKDWDELVQRFGRIDKRGRYFHMSEMNDMEIVQHFYRAIERHVPIFLSARFRQQDFERALKRIYIPGAFVEWDNNMYFIAFRCLMDMFHLHRETMQKALPMDEAVYFFFDETSDKKLIGRVWDEYLEERPTEVRKLYADEVRFEDDRVFLPLQAADFWAWWVRKWADNRPPNKIDFHDFGDFRIKPEKKHMTVDIVFDENAFVPTLEHIAQKATTHGNVVILPPSGGR